MSKKESFCVNKKEIKIKTYNRGFICSVTISKLFFTSIPISPPCACIIIKYPVLPRCVVDGHYRNPLYCYFVYKCTVDFVFKLGCLNCSSFSSHLSPVSEKTNMFQAGELLQQRQYISLDATYRYCPWHWSEGKSHLGSASSQSLCLNGRACEIPHRSSVGPTPVQLQAYTFHH